jgi:protein ImuA
MPCQSETPARPTLVTIDELRERLGLFSFGREGSRDRKVAIRGPLPGLEMESGSIVEWLVTGPGSGAFSATLRILAQRPGRAGAWVIVDPAGEVYPPAMTAWGADPRQTLLVRPTDPREACWAIEQCLRCPGVSATWACVEGRLATNVFRRWKLAAEAGGGVGILFRPDSARREPAWADLRLRVTPLSGGQGDARRIRIDVLYRRGGLGGSAQVWEIDHAAGDVRLVPEVAHPASADRAARA